MIEPHSATDLTRSIYRLDHQDRITYVSPGFLAFAQANHGQHLADGTLIGQSIWSHIAGPTTRALYADVFAKVRQDGNELRFPLRCDSPGVRRSIELRVRRLEHNALELEAVVLSEQPRTPIVLLDPDVPHDAGTLETCSFCHALNVAGHTWTPLESAIQDLRLMEARQLPRLTHGVCPACLPELRRRLGL